MGIMIDWSSWSWQSFMEDWLVVSILAAIVLFVLAKKGWKKYKTKKEGNKMGLSIKLDKDQEKQLTTNMLNSRIRELQQELQQFQQAEWEALNQLRIQHEAKKEEIVSELSILQQELQKIA